MWLWPATEATQGFVVMAAAGLKVGSDSFPLQFKYFKTESGINCGLILRFLKLERRARLLCRQRRLLFPASGLSSSWRLLRRLSGEFSGAYLESSLEDYLPGGLLTWRIVPGGLYLEDCTWRIAYLESGREEVEVQNPIHRHVLLGLSRNNFKWICLALLVWAETFICCKIFLFDLVVPPPVAHNVGLWSKCFYGHKLIKNKHFNDRPTDLINAEVLLISPWQVVLLISPWWNIGRGQFWTRRTMGVSQAKEMWRETGGCLEKFGCLQKWL